MKFGVLRREAKFRGIDFLTSIRRLAIQAYGLAPPNINLVSLS